MLIELDYALKFSYFVHKFCYFNDILMMKTP